MSNLIKVPRVFFVRKSFQIAALFVALAAAYSVSRGEQTNRTNAETRRAIPVAEVEKMNKVSSDLRSPRPSTVDESPKRKEARDDSQSIATRRIEQTDAVSASTNTMEALNDKRPIAIGDKISLTIVEDEMPQKALSVTDSGEVDIPYIGRVVVGNRTCKQLAYEIKRLLEKEYYYKVTVLLGLDTAGGRSASRGRFYISGQVARPGPYEIPVDEALTISKAILRAGGFTQYANKRKVKLMRGSSGKQELEIYTTDMVEVMEKGQTRKDMELSPDDRIVVDEKFFNF
jgi:protein involved in polysaccharide export with SLBB domain